MPICRFADLSICRFVDLPICRFADLVICRFADLVICRFGDLSICQFANLSMGECIFLVFVILLDVCTSVNIWSSYIVSVLFLYRLYRVDGYRKNC